MSLQALVWDFDGLILDTETGIYRSVREVFADHGVELDRTWWHGIIGGVSPVHWSEILIEQAGPGIDLDAVRARKAAREHELLLLQRVRPGVVELLDEAAEAGVALAIASSSPRDWVTGNLERIGLLDRFAAIVTRDDLGGDHTRTKPAPDLYLLAAEALGVAPGECVAIEDSPNGIAAAKAAGMACLAVPAGMTADLDCSRADRCVASLAAVTLADLTPLVAP